MEAYPPPAIDDRRLAAFLLAHRDPDFWLAPRAGSGLTVSEFDEFVMRRYWATLISSRLLIESVGSSGESLHGAAAGIVRSS